MERLVDTRRRRDGHRPRRAAPPQPHPARADPRTRRRRTRPTTAAISRRPRQGAAAADWDGFAARRAESRERGKLRGRGIGQYLEVTAPPAKEMGGIRFEADGDVTIITGTLDYGQGHASPFAQVLSDRLGIPFESIRLLQGDSDELIAGGGTGGSRSIMASGTAIVEASDEVIEQGRRSPPHVLEAASPISSSRAAASPSPAPTAASASWSSPSGCATALTLPEGVPPSLDVDHVAEHAARPSRTAATSPRSRSTPRPASIEVVRYTMVNDFGTLINPMIVEGQAAWRRRPGHRPGVDGAHASTTRTASSSPAPTWTTRCRAPTTRRSSRSRATRCRRRPTRSASRAAAKPAAPASLPAVMNALVDALRESASAPRHAGDPAARLARRSRRRRCAEPLARREKGRGEGPGRWTEGSAGSAGSGVTPHPVATSPRLRPPLRERSGAQSPGVLGEDLRTVKERGEQDARDRLSIFIGASSPGVPRVVFWSKAFRTSLRRVSAPHRPRGLRPPGGTSRRVPSRPQPQGQPRRSTGTSGDVPQCSGNFRDFNKIRSYLALALFRSVPVLSSGSPGEVGGRKGV